MATKHIFVTGGVVSSLGKGLTCAAIGMLLEARGLRVRLQKLDPYINVDPGTMNPYQHGEVYVTEDGAETDLDLGHYERFTKARVNRDSNVTTGRVYDTVIQKERRGEFLGETVQVVPHITNEIKDRIRRIHGPDVDVAITEIGGTVGDIEGLPFLEAIRQFGIEADEGNVLFIHLTLIPYLRAAGEIKTKPTQHSVGQLREIGIMPEILICRTEQPISDEVKKKIAMFCNVKPRCVIEERDVEHSIYELPLVFLQQGVDRLIAEMLDLPRVPPDVHEWVRIVDALKNPSSEVEIAVVGKYIGLQDAYKSIYEALTHGGIANRSRVKVRRVDADEVAKQGGAALLAGANGVLVPGGFGARGVEGKIEAVRWARETKTPFLGICLGLQCAAIEFARNACGRAKANSLEFDERTPDPVIALMEGQRNVTAKGGTMRLGSYPCRLRPGSLARRIYGVETVHERHRHRFEFHNGYREEFEAKGFALSGLSPDGRLVEMLELPAHPFFIACQFHPEFQSRPAAPHPLFSSFVAASLGVPFPAPSPASPSFAAPASAR